MRKSQKGYEKNRRSETIVSVSNGAESSIEVTCGLTVVSGALARIEELAFFQSHSITRPLVPRSSRSRTEVRIAVGKKKTKVLWNYAERASLASEEEGTQMNRGRERRGLLNTPRARRGLFHFTRYLGIGARGNYYYLPNS